MGDFEVGYRYVQHVGPVETATIISRVCCHLQWLFVIDSGQQFIIWLYSGVVAFTSTDQREVPIEVVVGVIAGLVVITLVAVIFALLFIRWDLINLSVDVFMHSHLPSHRFKRHRKGGHKKCVFKRENTPAPCNTLDRERGRERTEDIQIKTFSAEAEQSEYTAIEETGYYYF